MLAAGFAFPGHQPLCTGHPQTPEHGQGHHTDQEETYDLNQHLQAEPRIKRALLDLRQGIAQNACTETL